MIEVQEFSKSYGDVAAVEGLTFEVPPGRVTGFLGPNGAGKSTTIRMILGLARPDRGRALIDGRAYADLRDPVRHVGAVLETAAAHRGRSAYHHLLWLAQTARIARSRVDEVLTIVGLEGEADRRVGGFSLGMRQRLGLAAALLGDPQVLVLDEPANGLDPEGIHWLRGTLRRLAAEGRTVFVSSHLMSEMSLTAEHLIVIARGRLLADTGTAEFMARNARSHVRIRAHEPERLYQELIAAGVVVTWAGEGVIAAEGVSTSVISEIALANGHTLDELHTETASLEEAFLKLTGGAS